MFAIPAVASRTVPALLLKDQRLSTLADPTMQARRVANYQSIGGYIARYNGTSPDHGKLTDHRASQNDRTRANRNPLLNVRGNEPLTGAVARLGLGQPW